LITETVRATVDLAGLQDKHDHRMWREYRRITGRMPPNKVLPQGALPPDVEAKLSDRPDIVAWALGQE
jgi:hypothetical protein